LFYSEISQQSIDNVSLLGSKSHTHYFTVEFEKNLVT